MFILLRSILPDGSHWILLEISLAGFQLARQVAPALRANGSKPPRQWFLFSAFCKRLLIPINMRDGSLICIGKGNDDWNQSAPHGAGRIMSRKQAFKVLSMDEFRQEMRGIFTTSISEETLDESPMAYKSMAAIVETIGPTADIQMQVTPIYNFKAGE